MGRCATRHEAAPRASEAPLSPALKRGDALRLVPGDPDQLGLGVDERLGPGVRGGALAGRAPRRRRVPRETVHACTSCALSAGAGAPGVAMLPLSGFDRVSWRGPAPPRGS